MTHDEARQIINAHYSEVANTDDMRKLQHTVRYLSELVAEHMAWDSAIALASWIAKQREGQL